jgi:uncharacterized protein YprB with RNaseH-like and TPR domain
MRDLTARLRDIVRQDVTPRTPEQTRSGARAGGIRELTYVPDIGESIGADGSHAGALGGRAIGSDGACVVIDHLYASDRSYGRRRIESWAPAREAPLHLFDRRIARGHDWSRRVVFFDIETTGLSGGAGTLAFLAGCGWFDESGFTVRQFLLAGPSGERAMLDELGGILADASLLVTYNGRTFDVPFMETRWAFHRTPCPTDSVAHLDMLPAARRLWRRRDAGDDGGCSLAAIERAVLGVHRVNDVPGFEIPARYFYFLRTGDAGALEGVLDHNRHDIVSLAAVMSQALWLAREGPDACHEPAEQLALARLYERAGDVDEARRAYQMAARSGEREVRRDALASLATSLRRDGRYEDAARAWEEILAMAPDDEAVSTLSRRAVEALAIHHEHRGKDLKAARRYAEALGRRASGALRNAVDHRIKRIERKLGQVERRLF